LIGVVNSLERQFVGIDPRRSNICHYQCLPISVGLDELKMFGVGGIRRGLMGAHGKRQSPSHRPNALRNIVSRIVDHGIDLAECQRVLRPRVNNGAILGGSPRERGPRTETCRKRLEIVAKRRTPGDVFSRRWLLTGLARFFRFLPTISPNATLLELVAESREST
jgi:hypothetical protein